MPLGARLAYAAPGFAFALVGIPVYVHLPKFYGDVLGVDLAVVGLLILVSRFWDAVTDPAIGYFSDRLRTPWGRRRPFLFAAALPLAVSAGLLMAPPPTLAGSALTWWLGLLLFVLFLSWTAVQIPHAALGAELAPEHHARTGLFALRDGLWILGTLVAATAPGIVRWMLGLSTDPATERTVFRTLAWVYGPLLLLLPWICAFAVREPEASPVAPDSPVSATRDAWGNRPFRILLVAYAIGALGAALPATLILFYVEHVLRVAPLADALLGGYFLTGFLCLPFWTAVSRRIGKKRAWLAAMVVSVAAFSGAAFLGPGDVAAFSAIVVISGIGFGAGLVLPASLVADVVDYDEFLHGARREGLYYGLWAIVTKVSAALGAGAALPILKWSGYVALGEQPPAVLTTLRMLYAAVPCLCYAAALVVAARFPIDERLHTAIRHATDLRQRGLAAADPLLSRGGSA
jgi:GPH family glycoside/pentoside/hexuronide:cation symporter